MSGLILTARERQRLRRQLTQSRDAHVYRRTLALLEVGQGRALTEVARMLGVTRQSIYNWIEAYGQERTPVALLDAPRSGRPRLWTDDAVMLLHELLVVSPQQLGYPAANWTVSLLQEHLARSTGQRYSEDTIRRQLERMDYAWKRPRYRLVSDPAREKKTSPVPTSPGATTAQRALG